MSQVHEQQAPQALVSHLGGLSIERLSVLCPLGNKPQPLLRAVQAGLSAYGHYRQMTLMGTPMTQALVPDDAIAPLNNESLANGKSRRQERLLKLAATALGSLVKQEPLAKVPLLLAAPEKLPRFRTPLDDRFPPLLAEACNCELDIDNSYVLPEGRASGYNALSLAAKLIDQGLARQVLVGAVDTHFDDRLLAVLDKDERVLAQGVSDGFAPAEAAVFMLVSRAGSPGLQLEASAQTLEPAHLHNELASTGEALADACYAVLQATGARDIRHLCGTVNGESYYAREWGIAQLRHQTCFAENPGIHHPADCTGDTGAASALLNLAIMHTAAQLGEISGRCLLTASSELGQRTALLAWAVQTQQTEQGR